MNWKRMKVIAAVPVALAVTAGAVQLGISYRNGNGFHPFGTDREMKNNQILFPDSQESTGKQTDQTGEDDSSFLEKDNNKEDKAQQGNSSDYLFDGEDTSNPENRPTGALAQGDGAAVRQAVPPAAEQRPLLRPPTDRIRPRALVLPLRIRS